MSRTALAMNKLQRVLMEESREVFESELPASADGDYINSAQKKKAQLDQLRLETKIITGRLPAVSAAATAAIAASASTIVAAGLGLGLVDGQTPSLILRSV